MLEVAAVEVGSSVVEDGDVVIDVDVSDVTVVETVTGVLSVEIGVVRL